MSLTAWLRRVCCGCCGASAVMADEESWAEQAAARQLEGRGESSSRPNKKQRTTQIRPALPSAASALPALTSLAVLPVPPPDLGLTPQQYGRALELSRWSSMDLGWRILVDPAPSNTHSPPRRFFHNVWTSQTVYHAPQEGAAAQRNWENQQFDYDMPGSEHWIQECAQWMQKQFGIELRLWKEDNNSRGEERGPKSGVVRGLAPAPELLPLLGGVPARGYTPRLYHLLFYAHVLRTEFGIYPPSFLRCIGLRTIVLVDRLSLLGQKRMAMPLVESGCLLLDPRLQDITYLTNVLHHELFHMVDVIMLQLATMQADLYPSQQQQQQQERRPLSADDGWDDEEELAEISAFDRGYDFSLPLPPPLRAGAAIFAPYQLSLASTLHGVPDPAWSRLNSPGFRYGKGGYAARGKEMFLSSSVGQGTEACAGFLNAYSQSAVEEDKAEVYASLIRISYPMLHANSDPILCAKAHELKRRLEWLCPDLSVDWWLRLSSHTPHPLRPLEWSGDVHSNRQWVEKVNHEGHTYYFNTHTKQTAWVRPTGMTHTGRDRGAHTETTAEHGSPTIQPPTPALSSSPSSTPPAAPSPPSSLSAVHPLLSPSRAAAADSRSPSDVSSVSSDSE